MSQQNLSIEELSDRRQIDDLLIRYTVAIDTKDWNLLDTVYTPDAKIDYTSSGGIKGAYPEIRQWLEKVISLFSVTMHLIGNTVVEFEDGGDAARARTYVINPMGFTNPDDSLHLFTVGAYYVDRLVRTPEGWRIAERTEEAAFLDGELPKALSPPR